MTTRPRATRAPKVSRQSKSGWSLRGIVRAFLYQGFRHEAGCPATDLCKKRSTQGHPVECAATNQCPHFLTPEEPQVPMEFLPWLRRIFRFDAMRQVGCTFAMRDLTSEEWTALITVQRERDRFERLVYTAKDKTRAADRTVVTHDAPTEKALQATRKAAGVPPPGQSLFGSAGGRKPPRRTR